ncbi:MAG: hypothetical protein JXR25_05470 [Pontiellaceae bacterium]|nr:hypothetical protein [Pontiellaceae bacterium]MBN2784255.1 hypothetical protein [Pontiellaceae bacterium]
MKGVFSALLVLVVTASVSLGQTQSGIPARITAANGRQFEVFLQKIEDENIKFLMNRGNKEQSVPVRLITTVEFVGRYDIEGMELMFNNGDYQGMINKMTVEMKPSVDAFLPFMSTKNNLQDLFAMLMKAELGLGHAARAKEISSLLMKNPDTGIQGQAESIGLLAALDEDDISTAETLLGEIDSDPGKLYLGACVERAKGNFVVAINMVVDLIMAYPNDLNWMPQAELLNAHLYMDMGRTNSAIQTARQVKFIYANSRVGTDAANLYMEYKKAQDAAADAAKEREELEEANRAAVRAKAEERAKGFGFDAASEEDTNSESGAEDDVGNGESGSDTGEAL